MGAMPIPHEYRQLPEDELQRRFNACDRDACGELYRRHERTFQLQAHAWAGGNTEVKEEALGNFGVKLSDAHAQGLYDPSQPWRPWASTLLFHEVIDALRRRCRREGIAKTETRSPAKKPPPRGLRQRVNFADIADSFRDAGAMDPEIAAMFRELQGAVADCMGTLEPQEAMALILRFWLGMGFKEIGQFLGVSTSYAYRLVQTAAQRMKSCLSSKGFSED